MADRIKKRDATHRVKLRFAQPFLAKFCFYKSSSAIFEPNMYLHYEAARSPGFTVGFPTPSTSDLSSTSSCSRSPSPPIASISFDLSASTSYDGEITSKDIFEQDSLESYSNSSSNSVSLSSSPLISESALVQEIRIEKDHGISSASSSPQDDTNNSVSSSAFCGDR
ncbi:unnamed protein product [Oikopleura dioica]|uniref:Uncharacterized protein n=1 Tax=Oikopleura dioica TaxID=34765 RepID=E4X0C0_OIKDI|nr:unnamed protein product [Oikopleura dioica]